MTFIRAACRYVSCSSSHHFKHLQMVRAISTTPISGNVADDNKGNDSFESADDFEQRIFGGIDSSTNADSFFQKLDKLERARGRSDFGYRQNRGNNSQFLDGLNETLSSLSDGMDGKLKNAATYFEFDLNEIAKEDYAFRPDISFKPGTTYDIKDLDLTKPRPPKTFKRHEFKPTTEEVLRKADFRNVRFLANFITEAGIIIKRKSTGISAKAQRKVAREIKTARAFGLMPFTTMGTKSFIFGKTMEDLDKDYQLDDYDTPLFVRDPL